MVNEAMEKLCESMRRSAMSRTLVKQLSSARAPIARSSSGRAPVQRTNSGRRTVGRQISRTNSGKAVQRHHSGTADLQPVRRMTQDPKHRLMAPGNRGVFRNHSTTAVMGNHSLQNMAAALQQQHQQQQQLLQQQSLSHSSLHSGLDRSSFPNPMGDMNMPQF